MKKFEAFGLRHMRPSQIESMDAIVAEGGRAFVFLNIRIAPDFRTEQKRENRLVVLDWADLGPRLRLGSIMAKEIRELPYTGKSPERTINRKKVQGVFDLSKFNEMLQELSEFDF